MKNCFANLNRIEFVMTLACTGHCKHCSEGDHTGCTDHLDGDVAAALVHSLCKSYTIESLMTFGGEPLLHAADVCKIQQAATEEGIPKRHVITNGFFTRDILQIDRTAQALAAAGVNKVMLSVDAFHQETIPLEYPLQFAAALQQAGVLVKTHPAWLVSVQDDNPYNRQTRDILARFAALGVERSKGNVIFPSGNALKYLGEYFDPDKQYVDPYRDDPRDIRAISVDPDGSVLGGNIYTQSIAEIMQEYTHAIA